VRPARLGEDERRLSQADRWIELDESGEQPAPVLKLKAAAAGAKSASPPPSETASQSASPSAEEPEFSPSPVAEAETKDDGGLSTGAWIGIGAVVVVAVGGALYLVRRRGAASA